MPIEQTRQAEESGSDLLAQVGRRIRVERDRLGLTRRELSERSGVSQRFLANLEAGNANISILRLQDVAEALGLNLPAILGYETAHSDGAATVPGSGLQIHPTAIATLYRSAPEDVRRAVHAVLIRTMQTASR